MPRNRVLLVGDLDHRDFREDQAWLREHTEWTAARQLKEAVDHLAAGPLCLSRYPGTLGIRYPTPGSPMTGVRPTRR